jgi:hypothetical protein
MATRTEFVSNPRDAGDEVARSSREVHVEFFLFSCEQIQCGAARRHFLGYHALDRAGCFSQSELLGGGWNDLLEAVLRRLAINHRTL